MASKIELDAKRIEDYQKLINNMKLIEEYFRHGDLMLREVNNILEGTKHLIDNNLETSFTKDDFDVMLNVRDKSITNIANMLSVTRPISYYVQPTAIEYSPVSDVPLDEIVQNVTDPSTLVDPSTLI